MKRKRLNCNLVIFKEKSRDEITESSVTNSYWDFFHPI